MTDVGPVESGERVSRREELVLDYLFVSFFNRQANHGGLQQVLASHLYRGAVGLHGKLILKLAK